MAKAATAFVEFEGDFSKIQKGAGLQARGLESTFKSSFSRIAKFAKLALVGVGVGFGALGAFGLKAAGDFQQTRIAFEGILGSAKKAQTFLESLRKFAAKTPFEFPELATAAKSLLAVGFNANDVIPIMTRLGNVAATLGVGGEAINGVVRALGQMKGKGKASAEELNQISEQIPGFSGIKAIAEEMGVSTAEAFKKMSTGAISADFAVDAILKGMEKFPGAAGAMERQSKTLNGVLSTFKDTMRDALINGLEPILPQLSSVVEGAAPLFGKLIGAVARGVGSFIKLLQTLVPLVTIAFKAGFGGTSIAPIRGFLSIFARLGAVIGGFVDFVRGDVVDAGIKLGTAFGLDEQSPTITKMIRAFAAIRDAMADVVEFIKRNWKPILIAAVAALLVFTAPIVAVVAGLIALYVRFKLVRDVVAGFIGAVQAVSRFLAKVEWGEIFRRVADNIAKAIAVIRSVISKVVRFFKTHTKEFAAIGTAILDVVRGYAQTLKAEFDAVVAVMRVVLGVIIGLITVWVNIATDLWDRFGRQMLDKVRIAFNALVLIIQGALQVLRGVFEIIEGIFTLNWSKTWQGVKDVFGGAWKIIVGTAKAAINALSTIIGLGMAVISEVWHLAWGALKAAISGLINWVKTNWPLLLAILTGPFGLAIKFILDKFDGPKGLLEFVKKIPGRITAALVGIWDGLTKGLAASFGVVERAFATGVNAVIKIINGLIRAYNNTLGRIPGAPNIGTINPVTFGITPPKAADMGIGAGGVPNSIRKPTPKPGDKDFIGPVSVAAVQGAAPTVDARTVVMGNVYGDSHLRKILDDHDRELEQHLAVA